MDDRPLPDLVHLHVSKGGLLDTEVPVATLRDGDSRELTLRPILNELGRGGRVC